MYTRVLEVPNHLLIAEVRRALQQGHTATLRVKGYSMRLFLESNRDKVLLAPVAPEAVKVRDVVLAEVSPEHYVLHRVIDRKEDRLVLMGDGNIKGTETCRDTDVVGIAIAFYRKGRIKPDRTDGLKWRIYSQVWLALKPLRRIILGVYRRIRMLLGKDSIQSPTKA